MNLKFNVQRFIFCVYVKVILKYPILYNKIHFINPDIFNGKVNIYMIGSKAICHIWHNCYNTLLVNGDGIFSYFIYLKLHVLFSIRVFQAIY